MDYLYHGQCRHAGAMPSGERGSHPRRSYEHDMKAFLREMVVVAQDVRQFLALHRLHSHAVRQAVLLIETRFVKGQRIEE